MTSGKQLVYETILKYKGHDFADRWLADYEANSRATPESASLLRATSTESIPTATKIPATKIPATKIPATKIPATKIPATKIPATKSTRTSPKTATPAPEPLTYADALAKARHLLEPRRTDLGNAYPAALALTCAALEHGHNPNGKDANTFYVFMTYDTLALLAARAIGRDTPYTRRTIERWLSKSAPHADALRSLIGARLWYTDTLIDYRSGTSQGPVIGGTVFRVYLRPLDGEQVRVEGDVMRQQWRDLELDRQAGKTQHTRQQEHAALPELRDVGIYKLSKDICADFNFTYTSLGNTPHESNLIKQEYYIYPDMRQTHAVDALRNDVQQTATYLASKLAPWLIGYDGQITPSLRKRYLEAIWIAVKAELLGGTRHGFDLLKQATALADELYSGGHSLKNPDAYLWHMLESRGFRELRRDYGGQRIMSKRMFERVAR
jgi:hypothetical protein